MCIQLCIEGKLFYLFDPVYDILLQSCFLLQDTLLLVQFTLHIEKLYSTLDF